ncbi:MAG TPA: glycosyl transferase, partial [Gammaproteobacteria bacterium]|nr:glycosyl transferase [Gammaproteobacteria bacterium]
MTAALPAMYIADPLVKKYGGHSDQLSRSRWGMDRYRIRSLEKLLAAKTLTAMQERQALE